MTTADEISRWVLGHEAAVRLVAFLGVFVAMAAWEVRAPRRAQSVPRVERWPTNLGIVVVNTLILRAIFPFAAVGMAWTVERREWGLLQSLPLPWPVAVLGGVAALDLVIYLQHVLFHAVPALWRLHMVHHSDVEFDVTTGNRFHAIEIVLSMGIKAAAITALGPPVVSVLAFEILLNAGAMFNHGNVGLPARIDRVLRLLIVTPDMHRVHHSDLPGETNSNFGFNLSIWDRLMGTYREAPSLGHEGMTIGLTAWREANKLRLPRLLVMPFVERGSGYPLSRR